MNSIANLQDDFKGAPAGGFPAPAGGDPAGGLSNAHNGPLVSSERSKGYIDFYVGGSYVRVSKGVKCDGGGGGIRGEVKEFSKQSRRRLLQRIGMLKRSAMPMMITLTYPREWPDTSDAWKGHLKAFWKRVVRRWPKAACIWKLEAQKRGAPHYHLLVWGMPINCRLWVSKAWYEVVGSGDERHLLAGTRVEAVRTWRGVMSYASKYLGKIEGQVWQHPGRFWGMLNANWLPWADLVRCSLEYKQAAIMMRYFRRFMRYGSRCRNSPSLNCLCDAEYWFDRLDKLLGR